MSDLDHFLTRCYDVLLNQTAQAVADDQELCACSTMLKDVTETKE